MNSTNSSKPPSTDNKLTKSKKPSSSNSKKKRGAQAGHKGKNLKIVALPDRTELLLPTHCSCCNKSLKNNNSLKYEKRQLFDLPTIKMQVTEYCHFKANLSITAMRKICNCKAQNRRGY